MCTGDLVDLMVWVYVEDIDQFIDSHVWEIYSKAFNNIWAASAFKGRINVSDSLSLTQTHTLSLFSLHILFRGVQERYQLFSSF